MDDDDMETILTSVQSCQLLVVTLSKGSNVRVAPFSEDSKLPITRAASANQNVTNHTPRK